MATVYSILFLCFTRCKSFNYFASSVHIATIFNDAFLPRWAIWSIQCENAVDSRIIYVLSQFQWVFWWMSSSLLFGIQYNLIWIWDVFNNFTDFDSSTNNETWENNWHFTKFEAENVQFVCTIFHQSVHRCHGEISECEKVERATIQ